MNYVTLVKEFTILTGIYFIGEALSKTLHLTLPGSLLGMIILALLILCNIIKLEQVENAAALLLDNMALFFVPPAVGLMLYTNILSTEGTAILLTILLSTILVICITGKAVDTILRKKL